MVLNAESTTTRQTKTFDHVIVEAHVTYFRGTIRSFECTVTRSIYCESVIVRSHRHSTSRFVHDGLINPPVPKLELVGRESQCPTKYLIPEADAKKRTIR